jgi:hypothetical protein
VVDVDVNAVVKSRREVDSDEMEVMGSRLSDLTSGSEVPSLLSSWSIRRASSPSLVFSRASDSFSLAPSPFLTADPSTLLANTFGA